MKNNITISETVVHSFHPAVAVDVGVNAAVLFYNICFWVAQNTANERNFADGKYWTYNSVTAYSRLFPEFSEKQIRTALNKLEESGYIQSGCFNDNPMDKTKWYTVTDRANRFVPVGQIVPPEKEDDNNIYNNINNIPDNKQDTDNKHTDNSHKKAFSKEKVSYKAFSPKKEQKVSETRIPYDYTPSDLEWFIKQKVSVLARKIDEYILDEDIESITSIIVYFYARYCKVIGHRHPLLSDDAYERIILKIMEPPEPAEENRYNIDAYKEMIDSFFEIDYGKCSGNRTDYRISYFFSDKVFENLCWKEFYTGFKE